MTNEEKRRQLHDALGQQLGASNANILMDLLPPANASQLVTRTDMHANTCLLYTSPSPRDATLSRMPSSA